ncbi:MAG: OmpA family protein [Gammaproteobacteria bacterium]|nr:OmpA family protein [Gammaproteobacteria bacterium]MBU1481519.1 OmpA family protein [Gammaproteobacteria bacterium]
MLKKLLPLLLFLTAPDAALAADLFGDERVRDTGSVGAASEQYPVEDGVFVPQVKSEPQQPAGDKLETTQVLEKEAKTVKLQNVVPPIRFDSGKADIPPEYIGLLRNILDKMKDRANVRLHFVGYSDNVQLSNELANKYGDNAGLSRERAGVTAEYFQNALGLPPESISYEGLGEANPVASNATEAGKAKNRRVEVEVWYDRISDKLVEKEVVIANPVNRIKVCRIETVCKLRYKEGMAHRARIKNLVEPLRFDEENTQIPAEFLQQLQRAQQNLVGKTGVVIKFVGHTDNMPLEGRDLRIYGTHLALSKARARRVALAVQDALRLPSQAVDSDGKGDKYMLAANDTPKGRSLNRRIEVEYWYDDPLQELPDEPQICPESAAAETVIRVYDPPSGAIDPIFYGETQPVMPPGYANRLLRLMEELKDKANVRLRFVGYTSNERLSRRVADVYGDDIGLSTARARRVMDMIGDELKLKPEQMEHEGHGYVQSNDVVNAGFAGAERSRVDVQIVYDELAQLDDSEGLDITRITREVTTQNPYALNLMRITVDGAPVDDPGKSVPDVQRCTDVALDKADIRFRFDNLELKPRLNVSAWPTTLRYQDDFDTAALENRVSFKLYSNYPAFFERAEIRIFDETQSLRDTPLAVVAVNADGDAEWRAEFDAYRAPGRTLKYVLRVYDKEGHFDETAEQNLWLVDKVSDETLNADAEQELLVGYGENRMALENIPLNGGAVSVMGSKIPAGHKVWLAGRPVPVGRDGKFVAEQLLPSGLHSVEVAVLDAQGNGELFLRDLELRSNDWFYVGIADITAARDKTSGPAALVTQDQTHYDNNLNVDGRLAYYTKGKFGEDWQLTSSADTREGPLKDLFSNFMNKAPDAMFRRIDPDYYYPSYGDDSTVEEGAPTLGKLYVKLKKKENYGLWGNFKIGYNGSSLAHVDRSLYGLNLHGQSAATTSFGEQRLYADGFAAEPGTVASRDELRGTGGSLYYLRHQDILTGSEHIYIEIRDKDSGLVVGAKALTAGLDYDIDYLQGRILLSEPLSATVSDSMLVSAGGSSGDQAYLVVRYEYTPGFDDIDTLATGGRVHYWFGDSVKLGLTSNKNNEAGASSSLNGIDVTLRKSAATWLKLESSQSEGQGITTLNSADGGYTFDQNGTLITNDSKAGARRIDTSIALAELFDGTQGNLTLYNQKLDAGFSGPGLLTEYDTSQYGGSLSLPLNAQFKLRAKSDTSKRKHSLSTAAHEVDVDYLWTERWTLSGGVRKDNRTDDSAIVPLTQKQGERTDLRVQAGYDSKTDWSAYTFAQSTVSRSGNREKNGRFGAGGGYRVSERFKVNGEASGGDLGTGGKLGSEYLYSDRTSLYTNYAMENETSDNGVRANKGNLTSGVRSHYSDTASVYVEERYTHGDVPTGLTHTAGVDVAPDDRWNYGGNIDLGTLTDNTTGAKTERKAAAVKVGYHFDELTFASALEYRVDKTEDSNAVTSQRTTWLTKNSLKYQLNPNWRLIGKFNHSDSKSTLGDFYNGNFTEAVLGYAYRPVESDYLNALFKYTYFYNMPAVDQLTIANTAAEYIQKSHIVSADATYDVTQRWSVGGKLAYRRGQLSMDRTNPVFYDSRAQLAIVRVDWHFVHRWDALIEGRMLNLPDAQDRRSGALFAVYRHMGDNVKLGAGYNFTNFSDDLTDLSYKSQGVFINLIGKM